MFSFRKRSKVSIMYRHGDLLLTRINAVPQKTIRTSNIKMAVDNGKINHESAIPERNIIGLGEVTGHKHTLLGKSQLCIPKLNAKSLLSESISINEIPRFYFEAFDDVKLVHEEHKTLEIPKGVYKVTKEQQFDPFQGITQRMVD